MTTTFFKF